MPILTLLNWRWIAAAVLAAVLSASHLWAWQAGSASTQAAWDAATAAQTAATLALVQDAQEKERALQAEAEKLRRAKNAQINQLATDLADALDRLRNRPSRGGEGSVPTDTGAGRGCYPASIFREDAAVALNIAADADKLRIALTQCQTQYAKVRRQLTGENP